MLQIPVLNSIKGIEKQYDTGELPVLVTCSDKNSYICKYMRSSVSAYKLVSEFVGANMIACWDVRSPKTAFVRIAPAHWAKVYSTHTHAVSWGYAMLSDVADVNNAMLQLVEKGEHILNQLLKIALFDFWIANEDRTYNNANLLYDVKGKRLISIDYGGIFNTSSYDFPLCQLTSTDTILYADMFRHVSEAFESTYVLEMARSLRNYYEKSLERCLYMKEEIINHIPKEWNISADMVEKKINQLFTEEWEEGVWENFINCVTDNLEI